MSDPPAPDARGRRIVLAALSTAAFVSFWLVVWPEAMWAVPLWVAVAVTGVLWLWPSPSPPIAVAAAAPAGAVDAGLRDPHTGLLRRAHFLWLAERDWHRAGRYGGDVGLLLVEIDRLRAMTDRTGPAVADALLGGLGRQVGNMLRGADVLARFDDAQLAVFLPLADVTGALDVAERIRAGVEQLALPGLPPGAPMSASVGVSVLQPRHQPMTVLVADAQRALQAARQAGGNCVRTAPAGAASAAETPPAARPAPGSWPARGGLARPQRGPSES